jgi:hypothetical protein
MSTTAHLFTQGGDGTVNIDTWLTQEAGRIGKDIHKHSLHTSPWYDLIRKGTFAAGMGYRQSTLIYDRVLPNSGQNSSADQSTLGLPWTELGGTALSANAFTDSLGQSFIGANPDNLGPQDGKAYLHFQRSIKQYSLQRAVIESPRIDVEDLRQSFEGLQQLTAIVDLMKEAVRRSWEERNRDEYDRVCSNFVPCLQSGTPILQVIDVSAGTTFEGVNTWNVDFNNDFVTSGVDVDYTPTAHISNSLLDRLRLRAIRDGGKANAYGMEDGTAVLGLVISSPASLFIKQEDGYREDIRKNPGMVSSLIKPLGVDCSFRGYYHLCDDLAPRGTISSGTMTRVYPESMTNGILTTNNAYDTADYEVAYVLHQDVMETLIPSPLSGFGAVKFDPVSYTGDFKWKNIANETTNPDGTTGYFRGVLAAASKVVKPRLGYAVIYKRTSLVPAA